MKVSPYSSHKGDNYMNNAIYKNRNTFQNSQDQQYRISVAEYPDWVNDKKDKSKFIRIVQSGRVPWKKVNLKQKLKNEKNHKVFMSGNLQNIGYLKSSTYKNIKSTTDGICADFIFLDFDNKEDGEKIDTGYLTYDEALSILKNSGLNYVLSTSHSHSDEHNKLHILIPTLKPIDSSDLYKYYLEKVTEILDGYIADPAPSSIASNKNGGNPETIRVDVEFSKNDFHLEYVDLSSRVAFKKTSKTKRPEKPNALQDKNVTPYGKQVKTMFGMILEKGSLSSSLMFRRNENDNNPGVFNVPYDPNYNSSMIFDNKIKGNGHKKEFITLFNLDDYVIRKNSNNVKVELRKKISKLVYDFLDPSICNYDYANEHKYLVTNEGLGKSTAVLSLSQKGYTFIYVTCTIESMHEKANQLRSSGINCSIVRSVESILIEEGYEYLLKQYSRYMKDTDKPSFRVFLYDYAKGVEYENKSKLLNIYELNNNQIHNHEVVIMTSKKLEIMMTINQAKIWSNDKPIVFDEFVENEWENLTNTSEKKNNQPKSEIMKTWGNCGGFYDLYEKKSFFDLLEKKKVLVLTTERSLVGLYFWGSDYYQMRVPFEEMFTIGDNFKMKKKNDSDLELKLAADNVYYLLVKSTSKDKLPDMAKIFNLDNVKIISDGLSSEEFETLSHLRVKGMNNLSEVNTIVFGTKKHEVVVKETFVNNKEYFKQMFGSELSERELIDKSEPIIQKILIETQINQSIGRNSGFRYKGYRCVVIIPVMQSNSFRRIKMPLSLNYVSENVSIVEFDDETKKLSKVVDF
jgi:hypothetical protein